VPSALYGFLSPEPLPHSQEGLYTVEASLFEQFPTKACLYSYSNR